MTLGMAPSHEGLESEKTCKSLVYLSVREVPGRRCPGGTQEAGGRFSAGGGVGGLPEEALVTWVCRRRESEQGGWAVQEGTPLCRHEVPGGYRVAMIEWNRRGR